MSTALLLPLGLGLQIRLDGSIDKRGQIASEVFVSYCLRVFADTIPEHQREVLLPSGFGCGFLTHGREGNENARTQYVNGSSHNIHGVRT